MIINRTHYDAWRATIAREEAAGATVKSYYPYGAAWQLMRSCKRHVLCEGPCGTGKSRAGLEKINFFASTYPGFRGAIVRLTRKSMSLSTLPLFDREVLVGDRTVIGDADAFMRNKYNYPNGSRIVLGGLDNVENWMGPSFDMIVVDEATQIERQDFDYLDTRLRMGCTPYYQLILMCNPSHPHHWLNVAADGADWERVCSVHTDNPLLFDQESGVPTPEGEKYLAALDLLPRNQRERLLKGRWFAAEGMIYVDWQDGYIIDTAAWEALKPRVRFVIGSQDWGFAKPGCGLVVAYLDDGRCVILEELYKAGMEIGEWAAWWVKHHATYHLTDLVCDPENAEGCQVFDQRYNLPASKAKKDIVTGISVMSQAIKNGQLLYLRTANKALDAGLRDAKQPATFLHEIQSYVYDEKLPDMPKDGQADHAMDTCRYALMRLLGASNTKFMFAGG